MWNLQAYEYFWLDDRFAEVTVFQLIGDWMDAIKSSLGANRDSTMHVIIFQPILEVVTASTFEDETRRQDGCYTTYEEYMGNSTNETCISLSYKYKPEPTPSRADRGCRGAFVEGSWGAGADKATQSEGGWGRVLYCFEAAAEQG